MSSEIAPYRLMAELLDSLSVGLCLFDDADGTLLWNRTFLRLFPEHDGHVTVGEHYGENLRRFYATRLSGTERAQIDRFIADAIARHRSQSRPFVFEHRGQWIRVGSVPVPGIGRVRIWTPVSSPTGEVGFRSSPGDATASFENVADGVMVLDGEGRIIAVNEQFVRLYGQTGKDATVGRSYERVLEDSWRADPDGNGGLADWRLVLAECQRFAGAPFEVPLPADRWVRVIEQRADDGTVTSTHADITAMKRLQREIMRAREAAEAATIAKSQFLAVMSHELRTPMTGVIGMIDLLEMTALDGEQQHHLRTMRSSADMLLSLLNDILDYSKMEAGQLQLESAAFELGAIVEEVVQLLAPRAADRRNLLRVDLDCDAAVWLRGDPLRLKQVLLNLVGNAVKFTEGGTIAILVQVTPGAAGDAAIRLEIADTGIGMTAEQCGRLFQPFMQADAATNRRYGGTGLGLVICKRIVEEMGGHIGVESTAGEGTCVRVELALPHGEPRAAPRLPTAAALTTRPLRLFLAEDNDVNRGLVIAMLTKLGHRVETAVNGREAVERLQQDGAFDVVLMDVQMPEMDGIEATALIRATAGPTGRLPIVALTANATPQHKALYALSGFDAQVTKPIIWQELLRTIDLLAGGNAPPPVVAAATEAGAALGGATLGDLDEGMLVAIEQVIGFEALSGMLRALELEIDTKLAAMEHALAAGDLDGARNLAHVLKGTAGNFGVRAVPMLCDDLCRAGSLADARRLVAAMRRVAPSIMAALSGRQRPGKQD